MSFPILVLDNVAIGHDETLCCTRWRWEHVVAQMAGTMVRADKLRVRRD